MLASKMLRVVVLTMGAALILSLFASCKKDSSFKIERKWRVVEVTREGNPLTDFTIKVGDEFEFKSQGSYERSGANALQGSYSFNLEGKSLTLDGTEHIVYYAMGNDFSFGLVRFQRDIYTVVLKAK